MTRPLVYGLLLAAALLGPAVFWHNGVIDREATTFVRQYAADRPLLAKVFDPHANDIGTYQARELSYFLDYLDAAIYAWTARRTERAFFIPFSALVASALFVVTFLAGVRRSTAHVDVMTGGLLLACLLSSFAFVSTMGVLYRSSKPVLAVALLAWMFQVRIAHRNRSRAQRVGHPKKRDAALTLALALIVGLLDRQGFFYVLAGCALLFVHARLTDGELRDLLKATVAAAFVLVLYNLALAPLVIHAVNGYWPDFSYQRVPLLELLSRPQIHLSRAGRLLFMNVAMLFGGFAGVALVIVAGTSLLAWSRFKAPVDIRHRRDVVRYLLHDHRGRVVAYGLLGFVFQLLMFVLMIVRHVYIFIYPDHRYWYYPLPFLATVLVGALLLADGAAARLTQRERRAIPLILAVVVVSNVLSLGSYREAMITGPYFGKVYAQSELLKESIARGAADSRLEPGHRAFFDFDRSVRSGGPTRR